MVKLMNNATDITMHQHNISTIDLYDNSSY